MRCFIGLGSSVGDRRANLEKAARAVSELSYERGVRASVAYETPALVPDGAPEDWRKSYLNAVISIQWQGSAGELLARLKEIEKRMGRAEAPRWAPRVIDLDLLAFGSEKISEGVLKVPHPELSKRSFVLDPLRDLAATFVVPGAREPVVVQARKLENRSPLIMAIINVTPDSFSDGGKVYVPEAIAAKIDAIDKAGAHAIDVGAESTRPGAAPVALEEERRRLDPAFSILRERYAGQVIRPYLSVDTRRPEIAEAAITHGFDCVNDVGGFADQGLLEFLSGSSCDYVLMHSLSVPADPSVTLSSDHDPVRALKEWLDARLEILVAKGVSLDRVIFDPGIGFGKTARQSLSILGRMREFADLPVRLLVGHSRKSFLKAIGLTSEASRDAATLALSIGLVRAGVDLLRVHDYESHVAAFRARAEVS